MRAGGACSTLTKGDNTQTRDACWRPTARRPPPSHAPGGPWAGPPPRRAAGPTGRQSPRRRGQHHWRPALRPWGRSQCVHSPAAGGRGRRQVTLACGGTSLAPCSPPNHPPHPPPQATHQATHLGHEGLHRHASGQLDHRTRVGGPVGHGDVVDLGGVCPAPSHHEPARQPLPASRSPPPHPHPPTHTHIPYRLPTSTHLCLEDGRCLHKRRVAGVGGVKRQRLHGSSRGGASVPSSMSLPRLQLPCLVCCPPPPHNDTPPAGSA